ncbi:uncharacterized protein N0V89_004052 [Didymosphaeria variabile]|uniref:Uncharacterized protein n=1 Tax=Didymosphaeria variabile TaxID=1932322 RepID=A0A9W8XNR6_9PLEO|nr:uncharacterized protein N0V89_004052 [Didymosphaeria variabile]KAJ4356025.1 hypothetical protein N0V89_004052 [Didymosphaeria variabile]
MAMHKELLNDSLSEHSDAKTESFRCELMTMASSSASMHLCILTHFGGLRYLGFPSDGSRSRMQEPFAEEWEGGGLWMPEAGALSALRQDIDRKPHKIKRVLTDAGLRKSFLGGISNDEKKAVEAFANQTSNRSNALKKHPKVSCFKLLPLK